MIPSEEYVQRLLFDRFGVRLIPITRTDLKTPDFEVIEDGKRVFVAEVKTITYAPRTEKNGWEVRHLDYSAVEATRVDNAPARIGRVIYHAWEQLRGYDCGRVVIILNEEPLADIDDLVEAWNGQHVYSNDRFGYVNTSSMRIAEGDLSKTHGDIDLCIFIDKVRESTVFFRMLTDRGYELTCRYFDDGNNEIPPSIG